MITHILVFLPSFIPLCGLKLGFGIIFFQLKNPSFHISCIQAKVGLLVMSSLSFCLSEKSLYCLHCWGVSSWDVEFKLDSLFCLVLKKRKQANNQQQQKQEYVALLFFEFHSPVENPSKNSIDTGLKITYVFSLAALRLLFACFLKFDYDVWYNYDIPWCDFLCVSFAYGTRLNDMHSFTSFNTAQTVIISIVTPLSVFLPFYSTYYRS